MFNSGIRGQNPLPYRVHPCPSVGSFLVPSASDAVKSGKMHQNAFPFSPIAPTRTIARSRTAMRRFNPQSEIANPQSREDLPLPSWAEGLLDEKRRKVTCDL